MTLAPAVELIALHKAFGSVVANADIHLSVPPGTIHAVIGENGAGKSTAMKMLYGIYRPDGGEIRVEGVSRKWRSPSDAIAAGIGMVHQHFMLAGPYDSLENIWVGAEPAARKWKWLPPFLRPVNQASARAKLETLSRQYGLKVDFDAHVEDLPVGVQQRIEILKLLYRDAKILILDEPTAVLTPQETVELFANLRQLRDEGKTIIIITHKLKEVMAIADSVTVFRAGRVVGSVSKASTNVEELASLMVGRKVSLTAEAPPKLEPGAVVLKAEGVSLRAEGAEQALHALDFEVRAGEVVGIAGVEGNGQSELLQLLLHPRDFKHRSEGSVSFLGKKTQGGDGGFFTDEIRELGVGVIPEDRHKEALLLDRPVRENFLLGLQRRARFSRFGMIQEAAVTESGTRALDAYDVRPRSLEVDARGLSGGNQQKLIIAREFECEPRFLIAAQPTRGVDVGAIEFIHQRILRARASGAGVLLVSSELDEILALSDRILVMYGGEIVARFARGEANEQVLGLKMGGAQ